MVKTSPLSSRRILIMATDGFEQSELEVPLERLGEAGADVDIASIEMAEITGWDKDDWGDDVEVHLKIADADVDDYDALVLPGGQINPDLLRVDKDAIALIKAFAAAGKPIAAICHAPWLLVEAGLAKGRRMTSYKSIAPMSPMPAPRSWTKRSSSTETSSPAAVPMTCPPSAMPSSKRLPRMWPWPNSRSAGLPAPP